MNKNVFKCSAKGCQRKTPVDGPIGSNYKKSSIALTLEVYLRWGMKSDIQMPCSKKTIRKHQRRLECMLATWMLMHKVHLDGFADAKCIFPAKRSSRHSTAVADPAAAVTVDPSAAAAVAPTDQ